MRSERIIKLLIVSLCVCAISAAQSTERIIYVDPGAAGANDGSSWIDAYIYLQDALAAAAIATGPTEIRVAQGTYHPDEGVGATPGGSPTFFLPSGVVLRGGYAGLGGTDADARDPLSYPTVLRGANANAFAGPSGTDGGVVTARQTGPGTKLDGFIVAGGATGMTLTDANMVITHCTFEENRQYGIVSRTSSVTLSHCRFSNNPGMVLSTSFTDAVLTDCVFEYNGRDVRPSEGTIRAGTGTLVAIDCVFRANKGASIQGSAVVDLLRCVFIDNDAGRLSLIDCSANASMRQCRLESNHASRMGVVSLKGEATVADCEFVRNSARYAVLHTTGNIATVTRCSFVGNFSPDTPGSVLPGSVLNSSAAFTSVSHCLFSGNTGGGHPFFSGAIFGGGATLEVSNCTFSGDRFQASTISGFWDSITLTQCILWDAPVLFRDGFLHGQDINVTYSNIDGGYPGRGNIDVDPYFVRAGYWVHPSDPDMEVGADDPEAVWVAGDYHLQSQAGHWDTYWERWVIDEITSPCIDAGDPNAFLGEEPFPNGGRVNLGAYGGTREASRSYFGKPVCENRLAGDINGDGVVDQIDMDILLRQWLMEAREPANIPPAIHILSPTNGAELTGPDPIELRVEASDPDGYVWSVSYRLEASSDTDLQVISLGGDRESDDWATSAEWSHFALDGAYTITATATDNRGARTTSAPITVTLRP